MRFIGRAALAAFFGVSLAGAGPALLYDCDITDTRRGVDWISPKVAIVIKEDGAVVVSDAIILLVNKAPLEVRVTRNTDQKLALRWTLRNVESTQNQITPAFDYALTLQKKTREISLRARPQGYSNRFSGKGVCTVY
ncbi:MAG: hypothetical protein AAF665_03475 [Pseudomonadota bacterium]